MSAPSPRVALYCHNLWGLGHIARSVRIADAAAEVLGADCTIVTGCRCLNARGLHIGSHIHIESLPPAQFDNVGRFFEYGNPSNTMILQQRGRQILEFMKRWQPDAVVVDNLPLGLGGEMIDTLETANREDWQTRFFWGMPYPECEGKTNRRPRNPRILRSFERYDMAIAYTEESWLPVFPEYQAYGLPDRCEYVGMVAPKMKSVVPAEKPLVAVLAGGGRESHVILQMLIDAFREALTSGALAFRIVVGPLGDLESARNLASGLSSVEILAEASMEESIEGAHAVVSRVGYNSTFSLIQTELPLVFVPLPTRDDEQVNRGKRLAQLERVWVVDQCSENAAESLESSIRQALRSKWTSRPLPFRVNGAENTAQWIGRLIDEVRLSAQPA